MTAETAQRVADDEPGADEQPRWYIFTFGAEHALDGWPLEHCYVRIHGTWMEARLKMLAAFGQAWAFQYDTAEDAGVAKYHLTELVLPPTSQEQTSDN